MMIPENRFDFETCEKIMNLNDQQLLEIAEELSTWLEEVNWPIFPKIVDIFVERQDVLLQAISKIFYSKNSWWIYCVLQELYPRLSLKNKKLLIPDLKWYLDELSKKEKLDVDDADIIKYLEKIEENLL